MLRHLAFVLGLALLAHSLSVQQVSAQTCSAQNQQRCVDRTVVNNNCYYNFNTSTCQSGFAGITDVCQTKSNQAACAGVGCFWDSTISNCFKSLSLVSSIFNCSYWNTQTKCQYHGCAIDFTQSNTLKTVCTDVTRQGDNFQNKTSSVLSTAVSFSTPQLTPSLIFTVNISVPFVFTNAYRETPRFAVIQVLPPIASNAGPGALRNASEQTTVCSSFRSTGYVEPAPTNSDSASTPAQIQATVLESLSFFGALWDSRTRGQATLIKLFGTSRYDTLLPKQSYDTATNSIVHQVSANLTQLLQNCANRGVTATTTSTGVTYTLPISYVEHGVNGVFTQASKLFTIAVTTTGQVTIGATSQFHYDTTNIEVTYPQSTCANGQALQQITQTIVVSDVFDASTIVSANATGNILTRSPSSPTGPINCYGDAVTQYNFIGCNRQTFQCSYSFTTQSRCRTLTPDGLAFSVCSGASAADRIADMGSDIPYPVALDGVHREFVYHKICVGSSCTNTSQNVNGDPDEFRALIQTSVFSATSVVSNPFSVQGGFLPIPTADSTQFKQLTDQAATPLGINTFDGNVFSRQPVTIAVFMPPAQRADFDLRTLIGLGNTTIYPLDANGVRVFTSVPAFLDFNDIRTALLYTPKNALSLCAQGDVCPTLPACNGILGCDGFSIPVSQLLALMPANGYGFSVAYRVTLPGVPAPARRRLLQTSTGPNEAPTTGNVYFRIQVNQDGSITVEQLSTMPHSRTAAEAFAMSLAIVALSSAVLYLFTASAQASCASLRTQGRK